MKPKQIFLLGVWLSEAESEAITGEDVRQLLGPLKFISAKERERRIQIAVAVGNSLAVLLADSSGEKRMAWIEALVDTIGCSIESAAFEIEGVSRQLEMVSKGPPQSSGETTVSRQHSLGIILIEANISRLSEVMSALMLALTSGNAAIIVCRKSHAKFLEFFISQLSLSAEGRSLLTVMAAVVFQEQTFPLAKIFAKASNMGILMPSIKGFSSLRPLKRFLSDLISLPVEENILIVREAPHEAIVYEKFVDDVTELLKIRSYRSIRTVFTSSLKVAEDLYGKIVGAISSEQPPRIPKGLKAAFAHNALSSRYRILSALGKVNFSERTQVSYPMIVLDLGDDPYCSRTEALIRIVYRPSFAFLMQHLKTAAGAFGTIGIWGLRQESNFMGEFSGFRNFGRLVAFEDFREELLCGNYLQGILRDRLSKPTFLCGQSEFDLELKKEGLQFPPAETMAESVDVISETSRTFRIEYEAVHQVAEKYGVTGLQIVVELASDGPPIIRICLEAAVMNAVILESLQEALLEEVKGIEAGLHQQVIQDMILELYDPGQLPRDPDTGELLKFIT